MTKPDWIEVNMPWWQELDDDYNLIPNFADSELCRPGVAVKLEDGREFLIGHINTNAGTCSCCDAIGFSNATVKQYRIVYTEGE